MIYHHEHYGLAFFAVGVDQAVPIRVFFLGRDFRNLAENRFYRLPPVFPNTEQNFPVFRNLEQTSPEDNTFESEGIWS
jgi:hypothetical protein